MIRLDVHICDQRRSYVATFEGPQAEDMALAFMATRNSTHAISEDLLTRRFWVSCPYGGDGGHYEYEPLPEADQPYLIDHVRYPRLYATLYPTCEHGMSERGCYGPDHFASEEEIAQGW